MNTEVQKIEDLPIIDLEQYMGKAETDAGVQELCKTVAQCFYEYGILLIKDPRA
jgi:hypothetical protein